MSGEPVEQGDLETTGKSHAADTDTESEAKKETVSPKEFGRFIFNSLQEYGTFPPRYSSLEPHAELHLAQDRLSNPATDISIEWPFHSDRELKDSKYFTIHQGNRTYIVDDQRDFVWLETPNDKNGVDTERLTDLSDIKKEIERALKQGTILESRPVREPDETLQVGKSQELDPATIAPIKGQLPDEVITYLEKYLTEHGIEEFTKKLENFIQAGVMQPQRKKEALVSILQNKLRRGNTGAYRRLQNELNTAGMMTREEANALPEIKAQAIKTLISRFEWNDAASFAYLRGQLVDAGIVTPEEANSIPQIQELAKAKLIARMEWAGPSGFTYLRDQLIDAGIVTSEQLETSLSAPSSGENKSKTIWKRLLSTPRRKAVAAATAAALLFTGGAATHAALTNSGEAPPTEPGAGAPRVPGAEGSPQEKETKESAVKHALSIIDDLETLGVEPLPDGRITNRLVAYKANGETPKPDNSDFDSSQSAVVGLERSNEGKPYIVISESTSNPVDENTKEENSAAYVFSLPEDFYRNADETTSLDKVRDALTKPEAQLLLASERNGIRIIYSKNPDGSFNSQAKGGDSILLISTPDGWKVTNEQISFYTTLDIFESATGGSEPKNELGNQIVLRTPNSSDFNKVDTEGADLATKFRTDAEKPHNTGSG